MNMNNHFLTYIGKTPRTIIITIICFLTIIGIGIYLISILDTTLIAKNNVLGVETKPQLEGTYDINIDEYTYTYDWTYEQYTQLEPHINKPEYYIEESNSVVILRWNLKNESILELSCPDVRMQLTVTGEYYSCILKYNNIIVSNNIRYDLYSSENISSNAGNVSFVVYSDILTKEEYILTGSYAGESHDDISVFRLVNGKAIPLPFVDGDTTSNQWNISRPMIFRMYESNGEYKIITYYHEPSMGIDNNLEGIYEVWNISENQLVKEKTIGEVIREDN